MLLPEEEIISLSKHLSAYSAALKLQVNNRDMIRGVVERQLSSGNTNFLVSIPPSDLRVLLLLDFKGLNEQIIQATPKAKLKSFVPELSDEDFARIIYSIFDANNRLYLISFLDEMRARRWSHILKNDLSISEEYNKNFSSLKEQLGSLIEEKNSINVEINILKGERDEMKDNNKKLEFFISDKERDLVNLKDRVTSAELFLKNEEGRRQAMEKKFQERENLLAAREAEISQENQKLLKQKVEQSLPGYIRKTQALLKAKERAFSRMGKSWAYIGVISVLIAIYCGIFFTIYSFDFINSNENLEWKYLLINLFKGSMVVGVFIYIAQHAFNISNAYVHESIQRSDKRHAINFGELFLKIYGNSLQRDELLKVFENWNISTESAFKKISNAPMSKELANLLNNLKPDLFSKEKKSDLD